MKYLNFGSSTLIITLTITIAFVYILTVKVSSHPGGDSKVGLGV